MNTLIALAIVTLTSSAAPLDRPAESIAAAAVRIGRELADAAPIASQPDANDAWNDVRRLREGARIRVTLRTGVFNEGRLSSASGDRLTLIPKPGTAVEIARDDIAEVRRAAPSWIGGLVGVAAGGLAGAGTFYILSFKPCLSNCLDNELLRLGSLVGMPIAGGYLGSRAPTRWTTVYRSR